MLDRRGPRGKCAQVKQAFTSLNPAAQNPLSLQGREERCGLHSKEHIPAQTTEDKTGPQEEGGAGPWFQRQEACPSCTKNMIQVVRAAGAQMTQSQSYSWIPREKEAEPHQLGGTAILLGFLT